MTQTFTLSCRTKSWICSSSIGPELELDPEVLAAEQHHGALEVILRGRRDPHLLPLDGRLHLLELRVLDGRGHLLRFFFQAEDGIRDVAVTGVQTCALPISAAAPDTRARPAPPPRPPRSARRRVAGAAACRPPARPAPPAGAAPGPGRPGAPGDRKSVV